MEIITQQALRELLAAGTTIAVRVEGQKGGYRIAVRYGTAERLVCSTRQAARVFASLDTATSFLRRLHLATFEVDASGFEPGRLRKARPDRAEALRNTRTRPRQGALL